MRIGICGSMSVGKTTLVNALSEIPEFKNYEFRTERSKYLMNLGIPLNTDSTMKGQIIFLAERSTELLLENVITDRTIIDVMAFTMNSKFINYLEEDYFLNLASTMLHEYDYIFYILPEDIKIEDNGIRTTDKEYRDTIDKSIKLLLGKYKHNIKNLHVIKGSTEKRIEIIRKVIFS